MALSIERHVQFSPIVRTEQEEEQEEDDTSGSASDEIEILGVSTPQTSKQSILEDKTLSIDSSAKRSWIPSIPIPSIFRRGTTSPSKDSQASKQVSEKAATEEQTSDGPSHPEVGPEFPPTAHSPQLQAEIAYPELSTQTEELAQPLNTPGYLPARKGAPRSQDTYTIGTWPEGGKKRRAGDVLESSKPAKRQRRAKQPIASPKRSRGQRNPAQFRITQELSETIDDGEGKNLQRSVYHPPESNRGMADATTAPEEPSIGDEVSISQAPPGLPMTDQNLVQSEPVEPPYQPSVSRSSLINISKLFNIVTKSHRVGQTRSGKTWKIIQKKKEMCTEEGKRLDRRLDRLFKYSNSLKTAKEQRDRDKIRGLEAEISSTIDRMKTEVGNLISSKLEKYSDQPISDTKDILRDVYFHTIPDFTDRILQYAEIHIIEDSMETPDLREFNELVNIFNELLLCTTNLPETHQPIPDSKAVQYQTYEPGRSIISMIKGLRKDLALEIAKRDRAERAAEKERMRPELERARTERERLEKRARDQKLKERHRLQSVAFHKHLDEPLLGRLIRIQLKDPKIVGFGPKSSPLPRYPESPRSQKPQPLKDIDPFASDNKPHVKKRNHRGSKPTPLTEAQKMAFINTLRYNKGKDRYYLAAKNTQLSMDDVFHYAKEFQEIADRKHEQGEWNSEADEWTYEIWIEQRQKVELNLEGDEWIEI